MRHRLLTDLLEIPASEHPGEVALGFRHHGSTPQDPTYHDLWEGALGVAGALVDAGVRPGDRVLLLLPTSPAFVESFFGTLVAGAVPVPLAPPFSLAKLDAFARSVRSIAADCAAVACLAVPRYLALLSGALEATRPHMKFLSIQEGRRTIGASERPALAPSADALVQYTSGSTSQPKGVLLPHASLLANIDAIRAAVRVERGDAWVSWLPLYHDMGLIGMLFTAFLTGAKTVLLPPQAFLKDPMVWFSTISEHGATLTTAPNFAYGYSVKRLVPEAMDGVRLDTVHTMLNGAEAVDLGTVRRFEEALAPYGLRKGVVRPVYGLAESSLAVTFSGPGDAVADVIDADRLERLGEAVPAAPGARSLAVVSVGRPLQTQEVRIADERGSALPERRVGEVIVRGPSLMAGYLGRPEATAGSLVDGWLHTGDLGYLADGNLFIAGRRKDLIIRHGRNYHPQDIELVAAEVAGVRKGCVVAFGIEKPEDTSLVVVAETRVREVRARERIATGIREAVCRAVLFPPERIELVPPGTIPRTTSGKVQRQIVRQRFLEGRLAEKRGPSLASLLAWGIRSSRASLFRWVRRRVPAQTVPQAGGGAGGV